MQLRFARRALPARWRLPAPPGTCQPWPRHCYRCAFGLDYPSCELACATDLEELIRTTTTGKIAGFLAEPIQGVGGFVTPPAEYFETAAAIVRKCGGVFICDEVQTGFGRTGGKMFGIEHYGAEPEILTMTKGVANGMPLGVTIATPEVAEAFKALTVSAFGGNPMSAAATNATLDVIESDDLPAKAEAMGQRLRARLEELARSFPRTIGEVRGMGLMQAVELVAGEGAGDRSPNAAATLALFEETKKRGLLVGKGGLDGNVLRISPPLTVGAAEVDEALRALEASFAAIEGR